MSWANYYKARLPAQVSTQDALAAARRIVATCARPPSLVALMAEARMV